MNLPFIRDGTNEDPLKFKCVLSSILSAKDFDSPFLSDLLGLSNTLDIWMSIDKQQIVMFPHVSLSICGFYYLHWLLICCMSFGCLTIDPLLPLSLRNPIPYAFDWFMTPYWHGALEVMLLHPPNYCDTTMIVKLIPTCTMLKAMLVHLGGIFSLGTMS